MKAIPKFLGFWVIIVAVAIVAALFLTKDTNKSLITVAAEKNRFFVSFDLNISDEKNLSRILEKLQISKSSIEDLSFELDSISSTNLIYLAPIEISPTIGIDSIIFSGNTSHQQFVNKLSPKKIKIPRDYNLAIYASNVIDFVISKSRFPQNLSDWIVGNFNAENGQYLVVFSENADFSIISENNEVDLASLQNLVPADQPENFYKEEVRENTTFYLINIIADEKNQTIALFQSGNFTIISSSRESAFKIADSLNSKNGADFPNFKFEENSHFLLSFVNKEDALVSENFIKLISGNSDEFANPNAQKFLEEIEELNFALKATEFSGLISLK